MKIFSKETFKANVEGYTIFDCAFNTVDRFCFLLVEEKESRDILPRTRFLVLGLDGPKAPRIGYYDTGEMSFSTIARGFDPEEYVAVDTVSKVYSSDSKRRGEEIPIENLISLKTPVGTMVTIRRVVRVAGKVYAVGSNRRLYRREGIDQWVDLHSEGLGAPMPADYHDPKLSGSWSRVMGFRDLSAFNEKDFYAAGGEGDLWRFDGKAWYQCPLPTNAQLETVCCAGDGKVYVSDLHGNVWAGREDQWAQVARSELSWGSQPVDAFWFKGRMYFGAQEGLYAINDDKELVPLGDLDDGVPSSMVTGRIDISPDGNHLLTAGPYGACLFDGQTWTRLFSAYDFR
ncbi:hypothetical protein [Roseateles depolymerans]|uniref:Uncharacterized protein n=1 Tax=Roseateles depolymerans TaxID=76731 RepID=A0A0U3MD42_9BURK|nr:hypothetical protein [Roseateles depolymerans]ALV05356.1 hypothetical protein RD2015_860 [Roseateles depolymerans]REG14628.1 hypothetical protein DES44_3124 [Roseateles depolymerans]